MKERPILFSGEMVRAILDGRKTQTRRIIKPQPHWINDSHSVAHIGKKVGNVEYLCKYGQPGERLWVRETWCEIFDSEFGEEDWIDYRATPRYPEDSSLRPAGWDNEPDGTPLRWKPSIHMPRWASRITLEITGVRVERLQEISEEDAMAEGCDPDCLSVKKMYAKNGIFYGAARTWFLYLWNSINGYESWNENPWVWVIEFKRIEK